MGRNEKRMNLTLLLGLAFADKANYAPDMEMLFRTELGYNVLHTLTAHYTDLGQVALVDVQGLTGIVENDVYPARVAFSTKYNGELLYCIVDVEFYADDRDALLKDKPVCQPWTEDLDAEAEIEEEEEEEAEEEAEIEINFDE